MPQARKRANGTKTVMPECPHADVCLGPVHHSEVMSSIDELSKSIGMLLEKHDQHSDRLLNMARHMADVSERLTVTAQREAEWVRVLSEMQRSVAALGGSNA